MGINFNEIDLSEFEHLISKSNSAIICGNGLSINFDDRLSIQNLGKTLYHAHCTWKEHSSYKVTSNAIFRNGLKANYDSARKIINKISCEDDLRIFFQSALDLATQIVNSTDVLKWLDENRFVSKLVFGISQIDILREILSQAKDKDIFCVNYEYWSIMVYFVLVLDNAPASVFELDKSNIFIKAVIVGSQYEIADNKKDLNAATFISKTVINGVAIYLRFLFAINILIDGIGVNVTEMTRWNELNISNINKFFSLFNYLLTTNYDLLIEKITDRAVKHLHGKYSKIENVVLYQSLSVLLGMNKLDLSTIIVGDYFGGKTFLLTTAQECAGKAPNSVIQYSSTIIKDVIRIKKANTVVLFGLCADNDFHILRDLQVYMGEEINNAHIVFCYYDKSAKQGFADAYEKCISYSNELNNCVENNICVSLMDSKKILNEFFTTQ